MTYIINYEKTYKGKLNFGSTEGTEMEKDRLAMVVRQLLKDGAVVTIRIAKEEEKKPSEHIVHCTDCQFLENGCFCAEHDKLIPAAMVDKMFCGLALSKKPLKFDIPFMETVMDDLDKLDIKNYITEGRI